MPIALQVPVRLINRLAPRPRLLAAYLILLVHPKAVVSGPAVARALGCHNATGYRHLRALEAEGLVERLRPVRRRLVAEGGGRR
jgi:predicted ArsR family transcriptional regulator